MLKYICIALVIASVSAEVPTIFQTRGVVSPIVRCPDAGGVLLEVRVTDCDGAPPCRVVIEQDYTIEGDFIPTQSSAQANFRLTATAGPITIPVADGVLGELEGGSAYTAAQTIRVSAILAGLAATIRVEVYDAASQRVEVCGEAAVNIVRP